MADQKPNITLEEEDNLDIDLEFGIIKLPVSSVHVATTAVWNSTPMLIAESKHIYVYSDYYENNPGIKIGDGTTYLIDLPFVEGNDLRLNEHISSIITTAQIEKIWEDN